MKSKAKILTIVVVTKNNLNDLFRTLKSISQIDNVEIIVVDGDTNKYQEFVSNFQFAHNSYVTYIPGPDKGIYFGMNKGLDSANGKYILFLNSGDTYVGDFDITGVLEAAAYYELSWIIGGQLPKTKMGIYPKRIFRELFILGAKPLPHQSTFMTCDLLRKLGGFDVSLNIEADQDLFFRALASGESLTILKDVVSKRKLGGIGDQQGAGTFALQIDRIAKRVGSWDSMLISFCRYLIFLFRKVTSL